MFSIRVLVASLMLFGTVASARASVFYNAISSEPGGSLTVSPLVDGPLSASFSIPSDNPIGTVYLLDTQILVGGGSTGSGSFLVSLDSDSAGSPGTLMQTLATVADSSLAHDGSFQVLDISSLLDTPLTAGNRYWIELSDAHPDGPNTGALWSFTNDLSGVGVGSEDLFGDGTAAANSDVGLAFQMCVSDAAIGTAGGCPALPAPPSNSDAPEPASLAVLAIGLIGLGVMRRRGGMFRAI